jgi:predicted NUDIX family NTP pyrophosphohydrolase
MPSQRGLKSAGLLMYRVNNKKIELFLGHHGGPQWKGKDNGAWDIPKGETDGETDYLKVAKREFYEETGIEASGIFIELGSTFNKWGKEIFIWAFEGNGKEKFVKSNTFELEWPVGSGEIKEFPEIDRAEYMNLEKVKIKGHGYIQVFVDRLAQKLKERQRKLF